jgi:hypothetical protein
MAVVTTRKLLRHTRALMREQSCRMNVVAVMISARLSPATSRRESALDEIFVAFAPEIARFCLTSAVILLQFPPFSQTPQSTEGLNRGSGRQRIAIRSTVGRR